MQPEGGEIVDARGIRAGEGAYTIFLSQQLTLGNLREVRVLWGAVVLDVLRYQNPERIDELPFLEAKLKV